MKLTVSTKLIDSYKANSKNPNYSLSFLLNSIDPIIRKWRSVVWHSRMSVLNGNK